MNTAGKGLILFGIVLIIAGIAVTFGPKIPWLGRLPGDICVEKKNFSFYLPITTCILISALLTLTFFLTGRR